MTSVPPVARSSWGSTGAGERSLRRERRRRLLREELMALGVLVTLVAITLAVLAVQWSH
jgi:hypothetical protein